MILAVTGLGLCSPLGTRPEEVAAALSRGETALQAFRKHIHPVVCYFFIIALTFGVCGSVMGVMGIVSEISYEWSKTFIRDGIAPIYFSILYISMVYFIFWNGNTQILNEVRPSSLR